MASAMWKLCLLGLGLAAGEPKISAVTALLPSGARLRLEATGGCFRWSSQRPDLVAVEPAPEAAACRDACRPLAEGCEAAVELQAVGSVAQVERTLVAARDAAGPELRCEVYVAPIERIEVETSVRRIYVDDVETLAVKAYDQQGNVFSSLEGLAFRWRLEDAAVLRSVSLAASAYRLSAVRRALLEAQQQPDELLVQGVATGRTTVAAELLVGQRRVVSPPVPLVVLENIVLVPALIYVPPMAHLQPELKVLRGQRPIEDLAAVQLPVPHFQWQAQSLEGRDVLHVHPELGRVVTQRLGSGRVLAVDSRISNHSAQALLHVVDPVALRFRTQPLWRSGGASTAQGAPGWAGHMEAGWGEEELRLLRGPPVGVLSDEKVLQLVQGRSYALRLELLEKSQQEMQIPLNLRARSRCEASNGSAPLQLLHQASNSALLIFRAAELGEGSIIIDQLVLEANKDDQARKLKSLSLKLMVKQAFYVAPQLEPSVAGPMVLPRWHSYQLKVKGIGQQVFTMTSKPAGSITVSPSGRVHARGELAMGQLLVHDVRNAQNNFTMLVLVRSCGQIFLQPRQLQLRYNSDESRVLLRARPKAGPEDGCEVDLRNLTFWNCSALFRSLSASVSNDTVASTGALASSEFAACSLIPVRPLEVGRFDLNVVAQEADEFRTSLPFEVYKPLQWQILDLKDEVEPGSEVALAPCSSARLRVIYGPQGMTVPGQEAWNLTAGPHLVSRVGPRTFQVTCVTTSGATEVTAVVSHTPHSPLHGETFVDRVALQLRCGAPAQVRAEAELEAHEDPEEGRVEVGLQRGRATRFRARFRDAAGRSILNASEYWLRWSLSPSSKEGVPFTKAWLKAQKEIASIDVPKEATVGATAKLELQATLSTASLCPSKETLDAMGKLPMPDSHTLPLAVARKLELRWPGHPERPHFAIFNSTIVLEAAYGTGRARMELVSGKGLLEVMEPQACGHALEACLPALWIGAPCHATRAEHVQRWLLRPLAAGSATLALRDPELLGTRAQRLEVTLHVARQLELSLGPDTEGTVLLVCGTRREVRVDVRDAQGEALGVVNLQPLGLQLHSSDPGALELISTCEGYKSLCHLPGTYRLHADMADPFVGRIESRAVRVECLPRFEPSLRDIVVMPGQAFVLSFLGGRKGDGRTYFDYVSSAPEVASIDEEVGLVMALKPGVANLSVRLLERRTRRVIAEEGAHVTVLVPSRVSIGVVDALTGQGEELPLPGLLHGLRLRARLWSGGQELTPLLLALAGSRASPVSSDHQSLALWRRALEADEAVVEAAEAAAHAALQAARPRLPTDAAHVAAALGVGCAFRWSSEAELSPVGRGGLAVLVARNSSLSPVKLTVTADCPLGRGWETLHLEAATSLNVLPLLHLVPQGPCQQILVPVQGRVPLSFSLPRSQLKVKLLGSGVQLLESADTLEVEAQQEGEASIIVEAAEPIPALQISVAGRRAYTARIQSLPARLPLSATALCSLYLEDAAGQTLAMPSNFQVDVSSSLTSVVMVEVQVSSGQASLHLHAVGEGCTLLSMVVRMPNSRQLPSDLAELCVVRGALIGQGPLLLQPGARLNLDAELASLGGYVVGRPPVTFSLRLARLPTLGTLQEAASLLARELSRALAVGLARRGGLTAVRPLEVEATGARWSVKEVEGSPLVGAEVDLEVSGRSAAEAAGESGELGLLDLMELLWKENRSSETLSLLDLTWGVRGVPEAVQPQPLRCRGCGETSWRCASCGESLGGWSSTNPSLMVVQGPNVHAVAREPGMVSLRFSDGVVSATIQVEVLRPGHLLAVPEARYNLSNKANSSIRVRYRAFREEASLQPEDEFLSGPFLAQNLRLLCDGPKDFFNVEVDDVSCILRGKTPSLHQPAPLRLSLTASLEGSSRGSSLDWHFVPEFVVLKVDRPLPVGEVCGTLTASRPVAEIKIWSGGHPVDAVLGQSRRRLQLQVLPGRSVATLRVLWQDPTESAAGEEVALVISSPTGQVERCRLRIEPNAACGVEAGWSLLEMLLLLATVPLLYFLPRLCARPQAPETLHAAFQGVGAGPIFSGDPFAGPNAVSPFNALG